MEIDSRVVEALYNVISRVIGRSPYAVLFYGSRVAGYARDDSDYDVICIVEDMKGGLRYLYTHESGFYFSILLVDKSALEEDAYRAKYGEFIIGRLLSIYQPVLNPTYIEEIELRYKERVIEEELSLLYKKYGKLVFDMRIPLKYILFSRLNRRIKSYPPVKYSYIKTYYGADGPRNMRWAVSRFVMAAKKYIDSNLLEIVDEGLEIKSAIKGIEIDNYVLWLRGIKAYLTHGRSAKVSPKIVGEELKSKIIRSMDTLRSPREIEDPDILLELENSYFTPERQGINDMVKALFGTYSRIRGTVKRGLLSPLCIVKVDKEDFSKAIVIKAFNILWVFKWVFVQLWLIDVKRFTLHPRKRLVNEYLGLTWLKNKLSVNVPTPLLLDWGGGRLVMEYIDGDRLSDYLDDHDAMKLEEYFYQYGRILARIHREGYTLGDTKIQNILVRDDELYLIDVEQWSTKKDFAWDISLFIFYTLKFRLRERGILDLISKFVEGYLEEGGEKVQMEKAVGARYIRPFVPLVAPHLIYKVRKLVLQHS